MCNKNYLFYTFSHNFDFLAYKIAIFLSLVEKVGQKLPLNGADFGKVQFALAHAD